MGIKDASKHCGRFEWSDDMIMIGNSDYSKELVKECVDVIYERYSSYGTEVILKHLLGFMEYIVNSTKYSEGLLTNDFSDEFKEKWNKTHRVASESLTYKNIYNYAENRIDEKDYIATFGRGN